MVSPMNLSALDEQRRLKSGGLVCVCVCLCLRAFVE